MAKRGKKVSDPLLKFLERLDPNVRKLGELRLAFGKNLFNAATHKLRPEIRDRAEGKMGLQYAKRLSEITGIALHLFADESHLLGDTNAKSIARKVQKKRSQAKNLAFVSSSEVFRKILAYASNPMRFRSALTYFTVNR